MDEKKLELLIESVNQLVQSNDSGQNRPENQPNGNSSNKYFQLALALMGVVFTLAQLYIGSLLNNINNRIEINNKEISKIEKRVEQLTNKVDDNNKAIIKLEAIQDMRRKSK